MINSIQKDERNMRPEEFQRRRREILLQYLAQIKNAEERGDFTEAYWIHQDMQKEDSWMSYIWSLRDSPDAESGLPELGHAPNFTLDGNERYEGAVNNEINKYLTEVPWARMTENEKAAEARAKEADASNRFTEFVKGLWGDETKDKSQNPQFSASANTPRSHPNLQQKQPVTGTESILSLGYGPISTEYDDPNGLWGMVRRGEVSETYHDGLGSSYRENKPFADKVNGTHEAVMNNSAVFANAGANRKKEDVFDKVAGAVKSTKIGAAVSDALADTIIKRSGTKREANDDDFNAFISAFQSVAEKTLVPESTLKIPPRSTKGTVSSKTSTTQKSGISTSSSSGNSDSVKKPKSQVYLRK